MPELSKKYAKFEFDVIFMDCHARLSALAMTDKFEFGAVVENLRVPETKPRES